MIRVKGKGQTASDLPIGMAEARAYFADVAAFFRKIEAVAHVKALSRPGAFLITHHPMGALNHHVVMVACLEVDWHDDGLRMKPLDFDADKVQSEWPVVKGFIEGELRLARRAEATTRADFAFSVAVDLPLRGGLRLLPEGLVRGTADGIMVLRVGLVVESLFRQVLADFAGRVPAALRGEASRVERRAADHQPVGGWSAGHRERLVAGTGEAGGSRAKRLRRPA